MNILLFLLFGLIVGVVARLIVPGGERGGWPTSLIIGVAGSFLGGYLGQGLGYYRAGEASGFLMSLLGAVLLLIGYHALAGRRSSSGGTR